MSWEARSTGKYYYEVCRRQNKLTKTYYGKGQVGELAAELDLAERLARDLQRAERLLFEMSDALVEQLDDSLKLLTIGELYSNGWYQHGGEWRPRRTAPGR